MLQKKKIALAAMLLSLSVGVLANKEHSLSTDEAIEAVNKEFNVDVNVLFATRCAACHLGKGLQRGDGPALAETSKDFEQIIERINKGKTPMPAFAGAMKEEEIKALARYVTLIKPKQ
jgi:cytochrome c553